MNPAPLPGGQLQGQIALVTGATAFIGRAIALELARRGAHVIVNGRNPEAGQAVINEIAANGYSATFEQADLTNSDAVRAWWIELPSATVALTSWWPAAQVPVPIRRPFAFSRK